MTRDTRRALAAVLTLILAAGACGTTAGAADRRPYDQSPLRRDLAAISATGVTGAQARVTLDGRGVVATGGTAVLGSRRPVSPEGYFRAGSATKPFTATVVLQLAGEGRLSLEDTVEHWLPGVVHGNGNDGRRITIHELLQHQSGIHDDIPGWDTPADYHDRRFDVVSPETLVARAMRHRPDFAPGTGWNYCNTGYLLLGMIIKRVTGHSWSEEVARRITGPLGLRHTYWPGRSPGLPDPHSEGYNRYAGGRLVDVTRNREAFMAASGGGLISTTADLTRFYQALFGGRLLHAAELAMMRRTVPVNAEFGKMWPGARYGLGLFARPLSCSGYYWGHSGDIDGYMTRLGFSADGRHGAVVSISSQLQDSEDGELSEDRAGSNLVDHALCATS